MMNIIKEVKAFLGRKKKEQRKEIDTLIKIIADLKAKAAGMNKRSKSELDKEKQKKLDKEYKAVRKLLKKSRKRLRKLRHEEE